MAKKITELPASASLGANDLLVKDTGSATQKIKASDLASALGGGLGLMTNAPVTLWQGTKVENGTITLSDSLANYSWLLFELITNTDRMTTFVRRADFENGTHVVTWSSGSWNTTFNRWAYNTWVGLTKASNTTINISNAYNDANWSGGVIAVYGWK